MLDATTPVSAVLAGTVVLLRDFDDPRDPRRQDKLACPRAEVLLAGLLAVLAGAAGLVGSGERAAGPYMF